jgi:hypothetical protein
MPACEDLVKIVLSPEAASEISEVPLSADISVAELVIYQVVWK